MFQSEAVLFHPGDFLQKAEYLLGAGAHIVFCCFCIHGFFQSGHLTEDWEKASIPASLQEAASSVTEPEKASTGFPYFFASLAIPMGAFPITVWPSRRPSPVITMSAFFI